MNSQFKSAVKIIDEAQHIVIAQGENPDGDSLGSAVGLEEILADRGKEVSLYCSTDMPRHMRYLQGWDRVNSELPDNFDVLIIVDTSVERLLEKLFAPANMAKLQKAKVIVIDHHTNKLDLPVGKPLALIDNQAVAAGQIIYELVQFAGWNIPANGAVSLAASIMSDSLGLTSVRTSARSIYIIAELVDKYGVSLTELDAARRDWSKKTIEILRYKAELLQRIEYYHDNKLAIVTISLDEIKQYSDKYNPSVLVQEELRNVEEVDITVSIKVYDDRITGRLRANHTLICDKIAEHFGGGGHSFAAGFKTRDLKADDLKAELVKVAGELLKANA